MLNIEVVAKSEDHPITPRKRVLSSLTKVELHAIADAAGRGDVDAIASSVDFIEHESIAYWHGRARVLMCRRLRHAALTPDQSRRVVAAVLRRLREGTIYEGFRDQLRAALTLDRETTLEAARAALADRRPYVRRHAAWVLSRPEPGP
ncbi:MAG: hypothetical protein JNK04_16190 [Myxococcales bacterium]|nr:hypothetical protein [Myxococcales bacterium]